MDTNHPYRARPVGATVNWLTPPWIIERVGLLDLDPCAAPEPRPWDTAKRHITLPDDGLSAEWSGSVWLNPPYGRETAKWLSKLASHNNGIALVFARTDTRMFHEYVFGRCSALLFLSGRPHFHKPDGMKAAGNSGGPLVLIAYGSDCDSRLAGSGIGGFCVRAQLSEAGQEPVSAEDLQKPPKSNIAIGEDYPNMEHVFPYKLERQEKDDG
ncbi:MAG TPA: adenine methyltransferase [Gammaproteobacteria bacterium]|nr:adenine methyltransferase [Gammaproteobacteria bacterium]